MTKPSFICVSAPHTFRPSFYLEDELSDLPNDWEPTRENVKALITEKHFRGWLENMWEHIEADWDSASFVDFWRGKDSDIDIEIIGGI